MVGAQADATLGPVERLLVSLSMPDAPNILYDFFELSSGAGGGLWAVLLGIGAALIRSRRAPSLRTRPR